MNANITAAVNTAIEEVVAEAIAVGVAMALFDRHKLVAELDGNGPELTLVDAVRQAYPPDRWLRIRFPFGNPISDAVAHLMPHDAFNEGGGR